MNKNLDIRDIFKILRQNILYLIISIVIFIAISVVYALKQERIYRLEANILINFNPPATGMNLFSFWFWTPNMLNNQIYVIRSYNLLRRVVNDLDENTKAILLSYSSKELSTDEKESFLVNYILSRLSLKPMEDSDVIQISLEVEDIATGISTLTQLVNTYREFDIQLQKEETDTIKKFLESETKYYETELRQAEKEFKDAKIDLRTQYLGTEAKAIMDKYFAFQEDYYRNQILLSEVNNHLDFLEKRVSEFSRSLGKDFSLSNERINIIISRISRLESDSISLRSAGYDENNEKIKEIDDRLTALYDELKKEINTFIQSNVSHRIFGIYQDDLVKILNLQKDQKILTAKQNALKKVLDEYESELKIIPQKQLGLTHIIRKVEINEKLYNMLKEKYEEAKIQNEGVISKVQIVDYPVEPAGPVRPNRKNIVIIGFVFGIFIGLFFIFLRLYFFNEINPDEIKEKFGIKNISEIPDLSKIEDLRNFCSGKFDILAKRSGLMELIYFLKTIFQNDNKGMILISSFQPGEGKSFVSSLIAYVKALDGKKTLLLDLDLRKPKKLSFFDLENTEGIGKIYSENISDIKRFIRKTADNLFVLNSGDIKDNTPMEILTSDHFVLMIEALKKDFDIIIADTPPLFIVPDTITLSRFSDEILIVFNVNKNPHIKAINNIEKLYNLNKNVNYIALNFVNKKRNSSKDYYYYE